MRDKVGALHLRHGYIHGRSKLRQTLYVGIPYIAVRFEFCGLSRGAADRTRCYGQYPIFEKQGRTSSRLKRIEFSGEAMTQGKKSSNNSSPKYGKTAGKTVASAVRRMKKGTLKSGPGGKGGTVNNREQAIAIGLSEAREKGAKVPRKKNSSE